MYASWLDVLSSEFSARTFTQSQASFGDSNRSQGWCLKVRWVVNIEDPSPYWFVYAWRFFLCLLAVGTLWTVVFPCDFPCSFRFNLSGIRDSLRRRESAQEHSVRWLSDHWLVFFSFSFDKNHPQWYQTQRLDGITHYTPFKGRFTPVGSPVVVLVFFWA